MNSGRSGGQNWAPSRQAPTSAESDVALCYVQRAEELFQRKAKGPVTLAEAAACSGLQRAGAAARLSQLPRYDADGGAAPNPPGGGARDARRRADIDRRNRCRLPLHQSWPLRAAVQRSVRAVPIRAPAGPRSSPKGALQLMTGEIPTVLLKAQQAAFRRVSQ